MWFLDLYWSDVFVGRTRDNSHTADIHSHESRRGHIDN